MFVQKIGLNQFDIFQILRLLLHTITKILGIDKFLFKKNLQIFDARNIQVGRENGCKIATASDQKLGFYGKTPVDQPATIADPSGGGTVDTQARTALIAALNALKEMGLIASS